MAVFNRRFAMGQCLVVRLLCGSFQYFFSTLRFSVLLLVEHCLVLIFQYLIDRLID
jgi:hypothetical protein